MSKAVRIGARGGAVFLAMTLALQFLAPHAAFAANTTLALQKSVSVNGGPFTFNTFASPGDTLTYALQYSNIGSAAATSVSVKDILQNGQTLQAATIGCTSAPSAGMTTTVTCPVGTVGMGASGAVFIQTIVNSGFSGTLTNSGSVSATNATTQASNSTTVSVSGAPASGTSLEKFVEVNGTGFTTSTSANPGDTLTYDLKYSNFSGVTAPNVVVTDVLQTGQTFTGFPSSPNCAYNLETRTVTCSLGSVLSGTIVREFITTQVTTSGPATITNQASASSGSSTIFSNTTVVTVPSTTPSPFFGNFSLCGFVSSYVPAGVSTTGSITISGVTITIAAGTTPNSAIFVGANECVTFAFNNSGQANALGVSSNLSGLAAACGFFTSTGSGATINVSGVIIPVAAGATFVPFLVNGAFYCFLLNASGQATAAISAIPTEAFVVSGHSGAGHYGRFGTAVPV